MDIKFMSTKDRCLQCGEKLTGDIELSNRLSIETDEGKQLFCNAYCLNQWVDAYSDLPY